MKCNCKAGMQLEKAAYNATNKISRIGRLAVAGQYQTRHMLAVVFYVHALHNLIGVVKFYRVINLELIARQINWYVGVLRLS